MAAALMLGVEGLERDQLAGIARNARAAVKPHLYGSSAKIFDSETGRRACGEPA
jgi:hypothetical protein